jgi:hypothetical protein
MLEFAKKRLRDPVTGQYIKRNVQAKEK